MSKASSDVRARIAAADAVYEPYGEPAESWPLIRPLVSETVELVGFETFSSYEGHRWAIVRFLAWCERTGIDLNLQAVWHPRQVRRFLLDAQAEYAPTSILRFRDTLQFVGPIVNRRGPWDEKRQTFSRQKPKSPYSDEVVKLIVAAREYQPDSESLDAYDSMIGAHLGAGVTPAEFRDLRGHDVEISGDRTYLHVESGGPSRVVPVVRDLAAGLRRVAALYPDAPLYGHATWDLNHRSVSRKVLQRIRFAASLPYITAPRLRTTWLAQRLLGSPASAIPSLMLMAGLETGASVMDVLEHFPLVDNDLVEDICLGWSE